MITQRYFERDGERILFRIAVHDAAVFDILTTEEDLERCRRVLRLDSHRLPETTQMGTFGPFVVTLGVERDGSANIFVEGPHIGAAFAGEMQVVGAHLSASDLLSALDESVEWPRKRVEGAPTQPLDL